jgi:hypothetical protein
MRYPQYSDALSALQSLAGGEKPDRVRSKPKSDQFQVEPTTPK